MMKYEDPYTCFNVIKVIKCDTELQLFYEFINTITLIIIMLNYTFNTRCIYSHLYTVYLQLSSKNVLSICRALKKMQLIIKMCSSVCLWSVRVHCCLWSAFMFLRNIILSHHSSGSPIAFCAK